MEKTNHGMMAGGGDWDQDGVPDFLHMPFAGNPYKLFKGSRSGKDGVKFAEGGLGAASVLKVEGEKAQKCAWAWDFSGTAKKRGVTEYVGLANDGRDILLYELEVGRSRKLAVLATAEGDTPLLTLGDLNADGKMDLLYSSGLWNNQKDKTRVFVLYGRLP